MFFFSMGFRSSTEKVSNVLLFQEQKKTMYAYRRTLQNGQSGITVFSIMCLWVALVIPRPEAGYDYLFVPTQFDRVLLTAY
jgi:hypothetical protein